MSASLESAPSSGQSAGPWKSILLSMLVLATVFAVRGHLLAWLVGGRYRWTTLVVDCVVLALVILALRLLDLGVKRWTRRWLGEATRARRALGVAVSWSVVFLIAAPFLIALVQFHPQKIACGGTPAALGLPYEEVTLAADGLQLAAWHLPAAAPERPVVVVCHGLGANKQNFLPVAQLLHGLDYHVIIFDFRGHGDSDGRTFSFGVRESADVRAAVEQARALHPASKMYGLGYSVGGSALLKAAAELPDGQGFDRLVLDSTFARAEDVALHSMLWFFGPVKRPVWFVGRCWGQVFTGVDVGTHNPEDYLAQLTCPVLLIHGDADDMIPPSQAARLQTTAGRHGQLWLVADAGHLQPMGHPAYRERLQQFFDQNEKNAP
ncbi:MAG: alpha/beta fold hydrolase [Planctomycetia bacterium]|nr:alpha/beta fold hydrolase [Planctomycetia bacterium]